MKKDTSKTFLGHPKGLFYLFFAELWERFSFYGMRALLVLYMTKQLLFTDNMSFGVYAAYMSLVYFTPVIGGVLADRFLGYRRSIIMGGMFMAAGHFLLTIETPLFFYISLAAIIVGNGFFKPNISSFVGTLYATEDVRRDAGYTIFYMGVNVGGAIAPLLCAWLAESYGWHYGFMLAGFGMLLGLWYFYDGLRSGIFGDGGGLPDREKFYKKRLGLHQGNIILLAAIITVPLFALIVRYNQYEHHIVWISVLVITGYLISIYRKVNPVYKKRLFAIVYYTALMTLFWAIFEQAGSSLTLYADRNVRLIGMNAAQTNSINSAFIIVLAIPFSMLWSFLKKKSIPLHSGIKAGIGIILLGVGFVIFGMSARSADAMAQTSMAYLIIGYFVLTTGELCISPIGLSKMSELSPAKYLAFIMGVFFTSSFYGHFFAGNIAKLTAVAEGSIPYFGSDLWQPIVRFFTGLQWREVEPADEALQQLYSYVSVYTGFGCLAIAVGLFAIIIALGIKSLMGGVE